MTLGFNTRFEMKQTMDLKINSTDDLQFAARDLLTFAGATRIFLFYAPMGAGKTTLIKELCAQLGSEDSFSSPTYSIINEYQCPSGKIFHFDLYRLKSQDELFDLGVEELLDGKQYCFFEWPELVEDLLDLNYVRIHMEVKENSRYLRATLINHA